MQLRQPGQIATTDPCGKTEKVLDQRGGTSLAAGRIALQHDGFQSFGRGVNGRRKASRTRPNNRQVGSNFVFILERQGAKQTGYLRDFA